MPCLNFLKSTMPSEGWRLFRSDVDLSECQPFLQPALPPRSAHSVASFFVLPVRAVVGVVTEAFRFGTGGLAQGRQRVGCGS
jgi:hypothetical protein